MRVVSKSYLSTGKLFATFCSTRIVEDSRLLGCLFGNCVKRPERYYFYKIYKEKNLFCLVDDHEFRNLVFVILK